MFQQAHLAVDKKKKEKKSKVDNKTRVSIYLIFFFFLIVVALVDQIIRGRSTPGLEHTCFS